MMDDPWRQIAAEFRHRDATTITAALVADRIPAACVDDNLAHSGTKVADFQDRMIAAWRETGVSGRAALLLAVYVYVRSQQAWELSVNHDATRRTVREAFAAWQSLSPAPDDPDALAVELMLRHAILLPDCMEAEDALNCSCPVTLQAKAGLVVEQCRELLARSTELPPRWDDFRQQFLEVELGCHLANYEALARIGSAVGAWIEHGRAAGPQVASVIKFVREQELTPALRGDVYESELRSHRRVLETIARRIADPAIPVVQLDEASVTYCYPFALKGISGVRAMALALDLLGARRRELTDVWTWGRTKEPLCQAVSIPLPSLTVHPTADQDQPLTGHEVELRLSVLGNHAVYVRRRFGQPATLHDVNQAMRRGSMQMGPELITRAETLSTVSSARPTPVGPWERLPVFAEELVKWLVQALESEWGTASGKGRNDPDGQQSSPVAIVMDPAAQFQVSLEIRKLSVVSKEGRLVPAGAAELLAAGAPLFLHPVRPDASGLEEWIRNPPEEPRNLAGDAAFRRDLVIRTANTCVRVMTGTPNWVLLSQAEMIDFVASLPSLFQLWQQQLDPDTHIASLDLNKIDEAVLARKRLALQAAIHEVRRQLAVLHSPELVETPSYRSFLDRLYDAAGLLRLQEQVLETVRQVEAAHEVLSGYITVLEKMEQKRERQREEAYQQRVQLVLVIISFFSIADVLTFVNTISPGIPRDPTALLAELLCSASLALALVLAIYKPALHLVARPIAALVAAMRSARHKKRSVPKGAPEPTSAPASTAAAQ
jgi:hypothetical protein